jgi:hypothetical protein
VNYLKAILAVVGTAAAAIGTVAGNASLGDLSTGEWLGVAAAVLASGGLVWLSENVPGVFGGSIKAFVAGGGAFVAALIAAYQPDEAISQAELLTALAAAIAVLVGTYQIPGPTTE